MVIHWTTTDHQDCNSTKFKVLTVVVMMTIMIQVLWDTVYCWLAVRFPLLGHLGIWTLNMKEAANSSKMPVITYHLTHHIPEGMDDCLQTGTSTQIYRPQGRADSQWAYYFVISSRVKLHHGSMWVSCQLRYFSPTGYGPHMMDAAERWKIPAPATKIPWVILHSQQFCETDMSWKNLKFIFTY